MELEKFVKEKFEEKYTKKNKEVEEEYGPFEENPGPFSDTYNWGNVEGFKAETLKSVLAVSTNEQEAEAALDCIFDKLKVDSRSLSGYHHFPDSADFWMKDDDAIKLAKDYKSLRKLVSDKLKS